MPSSSISPPSCLRADSPEVQEDGQSPLGAWTGVAGFALVCICVCVSKTRDLAAENARGAQPVGDGEAALSLGGTRRHQRTHRHPSSTPPLTSSVDYASFLFCCLPPSPEEHALTKECLGPSASAFFFSTLRCSCELCARMLCKN